MPVDAIKSLNKDKSGFIFQILVYVFAFTMPISIIPAQIFGGLIILLGALFIIKCPDSVNISGYWVIFAAGLISVALISAFLSPHDSGSLAYFKKFWIILSIFPLVFLSSRYSPRSVLILLLGGTVVASLIGILRVIFEGIHRAAPYSGGYTTLAVFEAALLPVAFLEIISHKLAKRWIYGACATVIIAGLLLTGTRAGWLAAIVGVLIFGASVDWKKTAIAFLAIIILIFAVPYSRNLVVERFSAEKRGGFTSGRTVLYEAALERLRRLPFLGYGPASFSRLITEKEINYIGDKGVKSWHNTPLEVLMENGPLGLVALAGLSLLPLRRLIREYKKSNEHRLYAIMLISSLLALYIAGMTTNLIRDFLLFSLLIILWAISLSFNFRQENNHEREQKP